MKVELKKKIAALRINGFLGELRRTTQVSNRFLDTARPIVEKLFDEMPENRQAEILESFWQTALCEFETDILFENLPSFATTDFSLKELVYLKALENMKRQIQHVHAEMACIQIITYGGLGGRIVVEG